MATDQQTSSRPLGKRAASGPYARVVRWMENLTEAQFAYVLLTPALVLLASIALWPLLSTFRMSLFADSLTGRLGGFVSVENYVALVSGQKNALMPANFVPTSLTVNALFESALTVTLIFTVVSVFFETIFGFAQALVLNQDFYGRRWARLAIIIPWAVPIVVQGMIFFLLFQPGTGFLIGTEGAETVLQTHGPFGLSPFSSSFESTLIIIVADIWKTTAFMALLILAGLQSIDRNLYEVARVSGASPWQRFKYITLPLVLPTVFVAMLFRTIQAMRVYGVIETVSGCETVPSLSCLVIRSFNNNLFATSATVAFTTAAIIGVFVSVYIVGYAREELA